MRPGWYPDSSGTQRWWSSETGWTQDVLSKSGIPTVDVGPTPVTPPSGLPSMNTSRPISTAGRGSLKPEEPINPFPRIPVSGGALAVFAFLFVAAALFTRFMGQIFAVAVVAVLVTGVVCVIRLRQRDVDIRRHTKILLVCGGVMSMLAVGWVGVGFAVAARLAHDPERARKRVLRGWIGMGIAFVLLFLTTFAIVKFGGTA